MTFDTEYLQFEQDLEYSKSHKTQYWTVYSKRHGDMLGDIKWYGPWRQYVFEPYNALFNTSCLNDVIAFINRLSIERKVQRAATHTTTG
jgi:hypothetical protein